MTVVSGRMHLKKHYQVTMWRYKHWKENETMHKYWKEHKTMTGPVKQKSLIFAAVTLFRLNLIDADL